MQTKIVPRVRAYWSSKESYALGHDFLRGSLFERPLPVLGELELDVEEQASPLRLEEFEEEGKLPPDIPLAINLGTVFNCAIDLVLASFHS